MRTRKPARTDVHAAAHAAEMHAATSHAAAAASQCR